MKQMPFAFSSLLVSEFLDNLFLKYMGTSEAEAAVDMKSLVCWLPVSYNWGQTVSGVGSRSFQFLEMTW